MRVLFFFFSRTEGYCHSLTFLKQQPFKSVAFKLDTSFCTYCTMFIQCLTQGYKLGEKKCNTDLNLNKNCMKFKTFL